VAARWEGGVREVGGRWEGGGRGSECAKCEAAAAAGFMSARWEGGGYCVDF